MKYAVIGIGGTQYKVTEGQEILVNKLDAKEPSGQVLLLVDGKEVKIGTPTLENVKVVLKVLGHEKGKKIKVIKFKAKSRYRRRMGFRPSYSRLLVEKISS